MTEFSGREVHQVFIRTVEKEPVEDLRALARVYATLAGFTVCIWNTPHPCDERNPLGLREAWLYEAHFIKGHWAYEPHQR